MKRLFLALLILLALVDYGSEAVCAILVQSPNGTYIAKSTLAAANTAADAAGKTVVVTSPVTLTANVTLATDRAWKFEKGAAVTTTGYNFNANSASFTAGDYQVFTGTGTVSGLKESRAVWFGAKGDSNGTIGTDDSTAINAAAAATAEGGQLVLNKLAGTGYSANTAITIKPGINVDMHVPIYHTGVANVAALTVGTAGVSNSLVNLKLNVRRVTASDWTSEGCIGIKIINASYSDITITDATKFTIGVQCIGEGAPWAYNTVKLYSLQMNKYSVDLTSKGVGGWCNENLFLGGNFQATSSSPLNVSRYGVRITSQDGVYTGQNANVFLKPCFQLNQARAGTGEALPVLAEHGSNNAFLKCRSEGNHQTYAIRLLNSASNYEVSFSYADGLALIDDQSTGQYNRPSSSISLSPRLGARLSEYARPVFESGLLHKTAIPYDATKVHIPRMFSTSSVVSSNVFDNWQSASTGLTINNGYVSISGSANVGTLLDVRSKKQFIVRRDFENGYPGRIKVLCYDSSGVVMDDAGTPLVRFSDSSWVAGSKSYNLSSDNNLDVLLDFHSSVSYAAIIIAGGTQPARIRSWGIDVLDANYTTGAPAAWPGYEEIIPGVSLAIATPATGTYEAGRKVLNPAPVAGGYEGIVCTTAGTNGTYSEGLTATADGSSTITLSGLTSFLRPGDYVTINAGAVRRIKSIVGTTVVLNGTVTAGSGLAIAYSPAVFKNFGVIAP